ncbi:helix-turn-helix transcriptional regulator [Streptomyces sp. NPDC000927]|uniref:helix-turn-helix domain-containing protein n=1 Tax=Streptomyces sp. NPDC000927 TaxID=3154371 RepID=UPI00331C57D8
MGYQGKPTIRKKIIGRYLHRLREAADMSMEEVAQEFGVSRSAVHRQETGHTATKRAHAEKYLRLYKVQDKALAQRILDLSRTSSKKGWWEGYRDVADLAQVEVADLEDLAVSISNYEAMLIPGLLQTNEYSEALMVETDPRLRSNGLNAHKSLELRNQRKAILTREDRPELRFVFTEVAFDFPAAGPDVMKDQAKHLIRLIQDEQISIQILKRTPDGAFKAPTRQILTVTTGGDDAESIAYFDHALGGSLVDDQHAARRMADLFVHLQHEALAPEETARYLEGVLRNGNGMGEER